MYNCTILICQERRNESAMLIGLIQILRLVKPSPSKSKSASSSNGRKSIFLFPFIWHTVAIAIFIRLALKVRAVARRHSFCGDNTLEPLAGTAHRQCGLRTTMRVARGSI